MHKFSIQDPDVYKDKGIKTNFFIRFEDGPYKGVDFTADNYQISDDGNGSPIIKYDLDILYSPKHLKEVTQPEFDMAVGEIVTTILMKVVEHTDGTEIEEIGEDMGYARIEDLEKDII